LNRKAFTLIELLVVIAIIAILAAILFPVFAQAKAAAKKIASVSNAKQLELAVLMYSNDVDDLVPPATAWDTGNSYPITFGTGSTANWSYLIAPYIKTAQLYFSPQNGTQPKFAFGSSNDPLLNADLWPDYGYNYVYMSPYNGTIQTPISQTSADQPAATITLAERGSVTQSTNPPPTVWGFVFTPAADAPLLSDTVEVPVCDPIPQVCATDWGVGSFSAAQTTVANGSLTGGVALHAANQAIVSFMDGHTKSLSPGALAAGTNWSTTISDTAVVFTNQAVYTGSNYPDNYLWSTTHQ
jgi:prepilin-type N-terminal cleavage/methylation domain-containing protein